jgi:rhamnose utilization protein RhaD (predicted bifunctional aldolase and dehydrogenase)
MQPRYPAELAELVALSARIGGDIALVQAAGGNTSIKLDGVLWVKASGTWLADAERKPIFVAVDLGAAREALAAGSEKIAARNGDGSALKPSIETSLHAFMPHRVVLHVHAVNSIAWAVRGDAGAELAKRLEGLAWAWLPYGRPGLPLTRAVAAATAGRTLDVLILGNHGLVVGGPDCPTAAKLMHEVECRLALPLRPAAAADIERLAALCRGTGYRPAGYEDCHAIATDARSTAIATGGTLYPDHVVFLGPGARALRDGESLADVERAAAAKGMAAPAFVLMPGIGTAVRADLTAGAEALLRCLGLVARRIPAEVEVTYLPAEEERHLANWEAEAYRKALNRERASR